MRSRKELDEFTQKYLEGIIAKDPLDLAKDEKLFLKAREMYLTSDEKEKFADILKVKKTEKPKE